MTTVLVACGALSGAGDLGRQAELSFTRMDDPFVELYVAQVARARTCPEAAGLLDIRVVVVSHLKDVGALRWAAEVSLPGGKLHSADAGMVNVTEGIEVLVAPSLRVPTRTPYEITFTLPGRAERVRLHCPGGAR